MDNKNNTNIIKSLNNRNKVLPKIEFARHYFQKPKAPPKNKIISEVFKDYVSNTTLHGIKYLGPETSTWGEK